MTTRSQRGTMPCWWRTTRSTVRGPISALRTRLARCRCCRRSRRGARRRRRSWMRSRRIARRPLVPRTTPRARCPRPTRRCCPVVRRWRSRICMSHAGAIARRAASFAAAPTTRLGQQPACCASEERCWQRGRHSRCGAMRASTSCWRVSVTRKQASGRTRCARTPRHRSSSTTSDGASYTTTSMPRSDGTPRTSATTCSQHPISRSCWARATSRSRHSNHS
mmetsp:Transcript_11412/g.47803  ORF Transcript_11412/g.47803 Transcript_11412/m.47803 type:complete len:222 (+) Transcript_11412:1164-1829(+)